MLRKVTLNGTQKYLFGVRVTREIFLSPSNGSLDSKKSTGDASRDGQHARTPFTHPLERDLGLRVLSPFRVGYCPSRRRCVVGLPELRLGLLAKRPLVHPQHTPDQVGYETADSDRYPDAQTSVSLKVVLSASISTLSLTRLKRSIRSNPTNQ